MTGPLRLLRFLVAPVYDLVFGWLDRSIALKHQKRLADDVRLTMRFLFTQEKGNVIPSEGVPFPPGFDCAFVTIALSNVLLRVGRGRGELGVHVAPAFSPSDWHELSLVLSVVRGDEELSRKEFKDLWEVSRELQPQLKAIAERFSIDQFPELERQLENDVYRRDRIAIREAEAKINAWVYPNKD
jgi:hypothetical protein